MFFVLGDVAAAVVAVAVAVAAAVGVESSLNFETVFRWYSGGGTDTAILKRRNIKNVTHVLLL